MIYGRALGCSNTVHNLHNCLNKRWLALDPYSTAYAMTIQCGLERASDKRAEDSISRNKDCLDYSLRKHNSAFPPHTFS